MKSDELQMVAHPSGHFDPKANHLIDPNHPRSLVRKKAREIDLRQKLQRNRVFEQILNCMRNKTLSD